MARFCSFPGCDKPIEPTDEQDSVACSELHHLLLMCRRYCRIHPEFTSRLAPFFNLTRSQTCALDSCGLPCHPQHRWCSKSHHLAWLRSFCAALSPSQKCLFSGCSKHVLVEITPSPKVHSFCCWNHQQRFHITASMSDKANLQEPRKDEASDQHGSFMYKYVIDALKEHVHNKAKLPKNVAVDENFFSKHPWEVLVKPEDKSCLFVARHNFKGKAGGHKRMKNRTTKEDYHWKPTGPPKVIEGVTKKYLTYKRISRAVGSDKGNDRCFSMTEYTMDGLQGYCVINLYRGRKSQSPNEVNSRKKQKHCHQEAQEGTGFAWHKNEANSDSCSTSGKNQHTTGCSGMKDSNGNVVPSSVLSQISDDHDVCEQGVACKPGASPNCESSLDDFHHMLLSTQDSDFYPFHDFPTNLPLVGSISDNGSDLLEILCTLN